MVKLDNIVVTNDGKGLNYEYSVSSNAKDFLKPNDPFFVTYDDDISKVPKSIAVIPFLSNIMPIAWFAGFDVVVDEIDEDFNQSLINIKKEFIKYFPDKKISGDVKAKAIIKNSIQDKGEKAAMLFSGGVDSYATYIRLYDKTPDFVTYQGADIPLDDTKQWESFLQFVENENTFSNNKKNYIKSNLRDFYTYKVELLLNDIGWWGIVQHGLSLIGTLAPIAFKNNYTSLYIAATFTEDTQIFRGSTPSVDEQISWAGLKVHHEGYDLKRQDKVNLIMDFAQKKQTKFPIRVCYSELRQGFNCSNCEKCFRTILGIIVNNEDPNDYGFDVNKDIYDRVFKFFEEAKVSTGLKYYYWEVMEEAKLREKTFVFSDASYEEDQMNRIRNGELDQLINTQEDKLKKKLFRLQFIIRNRHPWLIQGVKKILGK